MSCSWQIVLAGQGGVGMICFSLALEPLSTEHVFTVAFTACIIVSRELPLELI